jgi:DNA repair exonuclease SbcCD ATPase subunit
MKENREQKKAKLMARVEKAIEELLEWQENTDRPNLTQIEDIILKLRAEIGEEMANQLLEGLAAETSVPGPACPKCGQEMRYKGRRDKQMHSRVGDMEYKRDYYTCPECDQGFFPPRSTTGDQG